MKKVTTKKAYFCIDFEEWFHIPYLAKYNFDRNRYETFSDKILPFCEWLKENNIKANIFVVGDIAEKNSKLLKKISSMGNQIGCHSYSHKSVNEMTMDEFVEDTLKSKQIIEKAIGKNIKGYRAPFFSLSDEKLDRLKELGFFYDSSYINSTANEYYNIMSLDGFEKKDSLVYFKNGFFEYEIPTLMGKPIAGGGFFRLYPLWLYKLFVKTFSKSNNNYILFIHPFEIAGDIKFSGLNNLNIKDRVRFQLGRKSANKKTKRAIKFLKKQGYEFCLFGE